MATQRKSHEASYGAFFICLFAVLFQAVICEENAVRGDGDLLIPTPKEFPEGNSQIIILPTFMDDLTPTVNGGSEAHSTQRTRTSNTVQPEKHSVTSKGNVVCVNKKPEQYKHDVLLKLKASSTCEKTKDSIQSVLDVLCGEDCKLEIYQIDNTNEVIVYGDSIEADPEGMAGKFNIDNIIDKVNVEEAVANIDQRSKIVLISILIAGLLLAALLIAGYILKTHRGNSKGMRLAEDSFQVDQENQGNTLLSVAPLPQQEPLDKPIINGESPDSPPTNGHNASQTQVADTPM
ncbi:uncharacterized protein si:ch211-286o17.1 isoform X2 [Danio aesculapii]|uniref:uncharacterized protein si:ch211-286o17.1 isoform X2 n=1 Tax=Danio aesculapii TaxID=1142201 RepID=UPI0024C02976|nr:uncharacterized protein si:ch211-286o17.1 isoform X2 [Danio aesculapii]